MRENAHSPNAIGHPAPNRAYVSRFHLLAGLFGAPAAWVLQMGLSQILTSYSCYPHVSPLDAPLWGHLSLMLACISIAGFMSGGLSVLAAFASWRQTSHELAAKGHHHVIDVGEGRTKFFAMLGILSSLLFWVAIGFTACAFILVSPCGA